MLSGDYNSSLGENCMHVYFTLHWQAANVIFMAAYSCADLNKQLSTFVQCQQKPVMDLWFWAAQLLPFKVSVSAFSQQLES